MAKFTGLAKLKDMELMARGNPKKLAEYHSASRAYKQLTSELFDDSRPFVDIPSQSYVEQLKREAEAEDADNETKARYEIIKERADYYSYIKQDEHFDNVRTRRELEKKLAEGNLVKSDLTTAERYVRKFPSVKNLAMYSQIKRTIENE